MRRWMTASVVFVLALGVSVACTASPAPTSIATSPPLASATPAASVTTAPPVTLPPLTLPPVTLPPVTVSPAAPTLPPTSGPPSDAPATVSPASQAPASDTPQTLEPGESAAPNEKIQIGDFQYVTMADAEYNPGGYSEFFPPDEGNVAYAFLMEFEGIDPEGSSYNPLYFKLVVNDFEYDYSALGSKEPNLSSGDLGPGETVIGWITFEAPLADLVVLHYEPVMGLAGDEVTWNVTVNQ